MKKGTPESVPWGLDLSFSRPVLCVVVARDLVRDQYLTTPDLHSDLELQNEISISPIDVPVAKIVNVRSSQYELSLINPLWIEAFRIHLPNTPTTVNLLGIGDATELRILQIRNDGLEPLMHEVVVVKNHHPLIPDWNGFEIIVQE